MEDWEGVSLFSILGTFFTIVKNKWIIFACSLKNWITGKLFFCDLELHSDANVTLGCIRGCASVRTLFLHGASLSWVLNSRPMCFVVLKSVTRDLLYTTVRVRMCVCRRVCILLPLSRANAINLAKIRTALLFVFGNDLATCVKKFPRFFVNSLVILTKICSSTSRE